MDAKKVLIVGISTVRGGVENAVLSIVSGIKEESISFDYLCFGHRPSFLENIDASSTVFTLPRRIEGLLKSERAQKKFWQDHGNNYDVIWINTGSASNLSSHVMAKKYSKAAIMTHSHSSDIEHTNAVLQKIHKALHYIHRPRLVRLTDMLCACSLKAGRFLFGPTKRDITIIPNGIDTALFSFDKERRQQVRKDHGIQEDDFVIGTVGRLCAVKNIPYALQVFEKVLDTDKNVKMLIVGDGDQKNALEQLVIDKKIPHVIFAGYQPKAYEFLDAMDCLLQPSLFEGFPVSIIEAQASGIFSILSDRITKEIQITDLVSFLPIKSPDIESWVSEIFRVKNLSLKRDEYASVVKSKGYDSLNSAEVIEQKINELIYNKRT